jgi:hypothetical protein
MRGIATALVLATGLIAGQPQWQIFVGFNMQFLN